MKVYCEECRDYMKYGVEANLKNKEIKGKSVQFKEKLAFCSACHSEVFVSEIRDENLVALDKAYRQAEGLISVDEIKDMLNKYNIGKRPMSLLLGWGETTLTRFINGDMPTKTYSDILIRLKDSPEDFLELLTSNREKLTEVAFNKSIDAVKKEMSFTKKCTAKGKIESAANYIICKSIEITPLALQKVLYFSQAFHRVFMGSYLFTEDCEAWVHGPVYRDIYLKYKDHGYNPIEDKTEQYECFELTESEIEVIDAVLNYFGCYSGKILETITHVETPWKETRSGLTDEEASYRVIEKALIEQYFMEVQKKYNMLNIADIKDYSSDMFDKVRH